ncbi:MAG: tetratricopeptide repeat protein [Clostridiales bacterium]|nr:tetratricopeptide repeat protein [Clostridiales bacterium]
MLNSAFLILNEPIGGEFVNAFEVLGLNTDADQQQVHQAYRTRVKECHPDRFTDPDMQKRAQEQLIELNLAYAEALRLTAGLQGRYNGVPLDQAKQIAKRLMEQGRYESALLQLCRTDNKDDEWYFIQGQVLMQMKQYDSAHQSFREAVKMEPENREYRAGALEAAVAMKKHKKLPYKVLDWADGLIHPRKYK